MGSGDIVIIDIVEDRLKLAKELGATHTLLVSSDLKEPHLINKVHNVLDIDPDVSFDCCGLEIQIG